MTWMASFKSKAELTPWGIPPTSTSAEAMKTGDCPNFFSNFTRGIRADFSLSIPARNVWRKCLATLNNKEAIRNNVRCYTKPYLQFPLQYFQEHEFVWLISPLSLTSLLPLSISWSFCAIQSRSNRSTISANSCRSCQVVSLFSGHHIRKVPACGRHNLYPHKWGLEFHLTLSCLSVSEMWRNSATFSHINLFCKLEYRRYW